MGVYTFVGKYHLGIVPYGWFVDCHAFVDAV